MYFIEGRPKHRKVVEEYISNLMTALNIHRFTARAVNIEFKRTLDENAQGLCQGDKQVALISINKSIPFLRQMQALAHEMVHAKQFLRGELNYIENQEYRALNPEDRHQYQYYIGYNKTLRFWILLIHLTLLKKQE